MNNADVWGLLLIAHCQLPNAYCQLPNAYCQFSFAHCIIPDKSFFSGTSNYPFSFSGYICSPKEELMYTLRINFEEKGMAPVTFENLEPGQTLLEICLKNDIELHHNCGGVCACTTCHLYIEQGMEHIDEITDKEEDFIDRAVNPRLNSRLGCQSLLLDGEGEIQITLPDQTQFLGE